jgi:hypothetical protein
MVNRQRVAQTLVGRAVADGRMVRPDTLPCVRCGKQARQYHHHNGYEPEHYLDVVPMCASCHVKEHPSAWQWATTTDGKAKISARHKGKKVSEATREKLRLAFTGRKMPTRTKEALASPEVRERARQSMIAKGLRLSGDHVARLRAGYKQHRSRMREGIERYYADPENSRWFSEQSRRAAHLRWHVRRGVVNQQCHYCMEV